MTPKQCDNLILANARVVLVSVYADQWDDLIVSRDRWHFYTVDGGKYDRTDIIEFHPL